MEQQIIMDVLRKLGVGRQYLGYNMTVQAIRMALLDENCLFCIKKGIFQPMSATLKCDWRTIERNIRTVIHRAWLMNPGYLESLAGYPMQREPTVTEFIELLSSHILRQITESTRQRSQRQETVASQAG